MAGTNNKISDNSSRDTDMKISRVQTISSIISNDHVDILIRKQTIKLEKQAEHDRNYV